VLLLGNRFTGGSGKVPKKFCGKPKMDRPKMDTKLLQLMWDMIRQENS